MIEHILQVITVVSCSCHWFTGPGGEDSCAGGYSGCQRDAFNIPQTLGWYVHNNSEKLSTMTNLHTLQPTFVW